MSPEPDPSSSTTTVGQAIRGRRTHLGWSLQKLADLIHCAKSYVSEVETGRRTLPGDEVLANIEEVMMLAPGSLVERAQWERGLKAGGPVVGQAIDRLQQENKAARRLAAMLREHAGKGKNALDDLYRTGRLHRLIGEIAPADPSPADLARSSPRRADPARPLTNISRLAPHLPLEVPLINAVSAGYPREFTDLSYPARVADEYVKCPDIDDPDAFAARVVGDSMMPDYRQGDVIVFSPGKAVKNGSDCFVRLERDAETTFKRIYFESGPDGEELIRLQPINNAYSPKVFPREDVAGLYVAVKAIREV
jgi:repressor LexA